MAEDPRLDVARYQLDKDDRDRGEPVEQEPRGTPRGPTMSQRAAAAEQAIQQAMRRGEFDNLPGAGKPLEGLHDVHDPDWWIRRKIERERLTGLGPPALTLRTESANLQTRLDAIHVEADVRSTLEEFNRRVIEARRQLQGGPPVVTPTRDVDVELAAWRERREFAHAQMDERRRAEQETQAALTWRERRRARREQLERGR